MAILKLKKDKPAKPEPKAETTPPATPETAEQPAEHGAAPASESPASFLQRHPDTDYTDPKLDTTKQDSMGNEKSDDRTFGPQNAPDTMTADQRQAAADDRDAKLRKGMASTATKDSTGKPKGEFKVVPQGHDKHGARIPDKVDYDKPIEPPAVMVGPRGVGAAKDSFHGARPGTK
jgi:hypothetical protein